MNAWVAATSTILSLSVRNKNLITNKIKYVQIKFFVIDKLKTLGRKANRDFLNAELGMQILEKRKRHYNNRDRQIQEKTDQLERELTGRVDDDIQPIMEFLKTATMDTAENYPLNEFDEENAPVQNNLELQLEVNFTYNLNYLIISYFLIITACPRCTSDSCCFWSFTRATSGTRKKCATGTVSESSN